MKTTITVCDTCKHEGFDTEANGKRPGEILFELVSDAALGVENLNVRPHSCLMGCERACNISIQAKDKLQYVLGRFEATQDAASGIVEYAKLYSQSETGQVPYKQWPQEIKGHFVARLPTLQKEEDE